MNAKKNMMVQKNAEVRHHAHHWRSINACTEIRYKENTKAKNENGNKRSDTGPDISIKLFATP